MLVTYPDDYGQQTENRIKKAIKCMFLYLFIETKEKCREKLIKIQKKG